jgi:hypothetical protein
MDSPYPRSWTRERRPANLGSRQYSVLNMLRHEGFWGVLRTAITGTTIRFVGYAFVDDTDLDYYKPES